MFHWLRLGVLVLLVSMHLVGCILVLAVMRQPSARFAHTPSGYLGKYDDMVPFTPEIDSASVALASSPTDVRAQTERQRIERIRDSAPRYFWARNTEPGRYDLLIVSAFSIKGLPVQEGIDNYEVSYVFRQMLLDRLRGSKLFAKVGDDNAAGFDPGNTLRMEGVFSKLDLGSLEKRAVMGAVWSPAISTEVGALQVGVEAKITEAKSGQVIFKFMQTAGWGTLMKGPKKALNETLEDIADEIVKTVSAQKRA